MRMMQVREKWGKRGKIGKKKRLSQCDSLLKNISIKSIIYYPFSYRAYGLLDVIYL